MLRQSRRRPESVARVNSTYTAAVEVSTVRIMRPSVGRTDLEAVSKVYSPTIRREYILVNSTPEFYTGASDYQAIITCKISAAVISVISVRFEFIQDKFVAWKTVSLTDWAPAER